MERACSIPRGHSVPVDAWVDVAEAVYLSTPVQHQAEGAKRYGLHTYREHTCNEPATAAASVRAVVRARRRGAMRSQTSKR